MKKRIYETPIINSLEFTFDVIMASGSVSGISGGTITVNGNYDSSNWW